MSKGPEEFMPKKNRSIPMQKEINPVLDRERYNIYKLGDRAE